MNRIISKPEIILFFSFPFFIAHTFADPPEAVKNEFFAHRQRQREARLSATTSYPNLQPRTVIGLNKPDDSPNDFQSGNWAGAMTTPPPSGTFNSVVAQWTVPSVSLPSGAGGANTWYTAMWVGIDGDYPQIPCQTIFQAGVTSYITVDSSGAVTSTGAYAWYLWHPDYETQISDFPVAFGDTVEVLVYAAFPSQGEVVIRNPNTQAEKSVTLSPSSPSGNLCGMSAEWIVEDTSGSGGALPFANFGNVLFQSCGATTTTGGSADLTAAALVTLVQNKDALATPARVSSNELQVSYG